jgi:hypothetical protein
LRPQKQTSDAERLFASALHFVDHAPFFIFHECVSMAAVPPQPGDILILASSTCPVMDSDLAVGARENAAHSDGSDRSGAVCHQRTIGGRPDCTKMSEEIGPREFGID